MFSNQDPKQQNQTNQKLSPNIQQKYLENIENFLQKGI
jgi:hypothetical protein